MVKEPATVAPKDPGFVQGSAAAVGGDIQAQGGIEATTSNGYTAQYTVYTQRGKRLADEVQSAYKRLTQQQVTNRTVTYSVFQPHAGQERCRRGSLGKRSACFGLRSTWLARGGVRRTLTMLRPLQTWRKCAGWLTSTARRKPCTWRSGALTSMCMLAVQPWAGFCKCCQSVPVLPAQTGAQPGP